MRRLGVNIVLASLTAVALRDDWGAKAKLTSTVMLGSSAAAAYCLTCPTAARL